MVNVLKISIVQKIFCNQRPTHTAVAKQMIFIHSSLPYTEKSEARHVKASSQKKNMKEGKFARIDIFPFMSFPPRFDSFQLFTTKACAKVSDMVSKDERA